MDKTDKKVPSSIVFLVICGIYYFGTIPIFAGIAYVYKVLEISSSSLKADLSGKIFLAQTFLAIFMICYLWSKYEDYFLGDNWKGNIKQYIVTGLKWSVPVLIYHSFSVFVPSLREKLINDVSSLDIISSDSLSGLGLLMLFCLILAGVVIEEFIFRGMLLNKIRDFFSAHVSLVLSSLIFALSHFLYSKIVPGDMVSHFLIGILCGAAFLSSRSCISAFVPHLLNNLICSLYIYGVSRTL